MTSRSWLIPYLTLAAIWGCSFALNKTALGSFTPIQLTTGRMVTGAVTVLLFLAATRAIPRPNLQEWRHLAVVGIVGLALPFLLIAFAQTRITSILAGLLNATTPLFAGLFIAWFVPAERPRRTQLIGLFVGFVGMAVLIGVWNLANGAVDPIGVAAMIGATVCYGFGTSFARVSLSSSQLSGAQLSGVQLLSGAALSLLVLPAAGTQPAGPITPGAVASVIALGALGTGLAMVLFWRVLREAGSTVAATVTYAVPVVSTSVGALVLSEHLAWNQIVGGMIVIAGVVLTQWDQLHGKGVPDEEPAHNPQDREARTNE